MATLHSYQSRETQALEALFPRWREMLARIVWGGYDALDPEQPVATIKKWVFSYTIRVKDLRPVLVLILGEPPA